MKNKLYQKTWFWLMIISIILFLNLIVFACKYIDIKNLLINECFWVAIGSICALSSVIIAAGSIVSSEKIRKKQATYDAFSEFKKSNYNIEIEIEKYDINNLIDKHEIGNDSEWNTVKQYLVAIERLATCTNNRIFDYETIYNMSGPYIIRQYEFLKPIIEYKRKAEQRKVYGEFENMVDSLKIIQLKHKEEK